MIRKRMGGIRLLLLVGWLLSLLATNVVLATPAALTITGTWFDAEALGSLLPGPECLEYSEDFTQARYGLDDVWQTSCAITPFSEKSGLSFVGETLVSAESQCTPGQSTRIQIAEMTHFNLPNVVSGLGGDADGRPALFKLRVTLAGPIAANFPVTVHMEETRNAPSSYPNNDYLIFNTHHQDVSDQCPYPVGSSGSGDPAYDAVNLDSNNNGVEECADRVSFAETATGFTFNDQSGDLCHVTLAGFGPCGGAPNAGPIQFLSSEFQDNSTCLFATLDVPGQLIIQKTVLYDSDPESFDFAFVIEDDAENRASATSITNDTSGSTVSAAPILLRAGEYTVAERLGEGWVAGEIACVDGSGQAVGSADLSSATVTALPITAGETTVCAFTNLGGGPTAITQLTGEAARAGATVTLIFSLVIMSLLTAATVLFSRRNTPQ